MKLPNPQDDTTDDNRKAVGDSPSKYGHSFHIHAPYVSLCRTTGNEVLRASSPVKDNNDVTIPSEASVANYATIPPEALANYVRKYCFKNPQEDDSDESSTGGLSDHPSLPDLVPQVIEPNERTHVTSDNPLGFTPWFVRVFTWEVGTEFERVD